MKLLVDTHLLLWTASTSRLVSDEARALIDAPDNQLLFSVATIWETAIKYGLRKPHFGFEPRRFRENLLRAGFRELEISSEHAITAGTLPDLHRDPFDRLLIAQAEVEGAMLLTSDTMVARYPGPIRLV
jgi:PIN domain nuclease of toxin-antitoxin system